MKHSTKCKEWEYHVISDLILNGVCCSSSLLKEDIVAQLEDLRRADKGPITWNKYQTKEEVKIMKTAGLFTMEWK